MRLIISYDCKDKISSDENILISSYEILWTQRSISAKRFDFI